MFCLNQQLCGSIDNGDSKGIDSADFKIVEFDGLKKEEGANPLSMSELNGLTVQMPLELYPSLNDIVELLHIQISLLNSLHGFLQNSSCTS